MKPLLKIYHKVLVWCGAQVSSFPMTNDTTGCSNSDMQHLIWYLLLNTDPVGDFIDQFEVSGSPPPGIKKIIKESKEKARKGERRIGDNVPNRQVKKEKPESTMPNERGITKKRSREELIVDAELGRGKRRKKANPLPTGARPAIFALPEVVDFPPEEEDTTLRRLGVLETEQSSLEREILLDMAQNGISSRTLFFPTALGIKTQSMKVCSFCTPAACTATLMTALGNDLISGIKAYGDRRGRNTEDDKMGKGNDLFGKMAQQYAAQPLRAQIQDELLKKQLQDRSRQHLHHQIQFLQQMQMAKGQQIQHLQMQQLQKMQMQHYQLQMQNQQKQKQALYVPKPLPQSALQAAQAAQAAHANHQAAEAPKSPQPPQSPLSQLPQSPTLQLPQSPPPQLPQSPPPQLPQSPPLQLPQSPPLQLPQSPPSHLGPRSSQQILQGGSENFLQPSNVVEVPKKQEQQIKRENPSVASRSPLLDSASLPNNNQPPSTFNQPPLTLPPHSQTFFAKPTPSRVLPPPLPLSPFLQPPLQQPQQNTLLRQTPPFNPNEVGSGSLPVAKPQNPLLPPASMYALQAAQLEAAQRQLRAQAAQQGQTPQLTNQLNLLQAAQAQLRAAQQLQQFVQTPK